MLQLKLRREVTVTSGRLHDALTGSTHPLSELGRSVVGALGGSADEVIRAVPAPRVAVERELRQLLLLGLLEGTCDTFRARFERLRDGELLPRVLPGSRFACQHSGACCRGYLFGPISESEKARIEALDPATVLPALVGKTLFEAIPGTAAYRLATVGEDCVFLEPGSRCGLHRAFGAEAKPTLCRLFPLAAVATIDGVKLYDRGECATFGVSARSGAELETELPRILPLVDRRPYHPSVSLHGSWRCDYGLVLALAERLDAEACERPPLDALHAIGHITRGYIRALTQCPLDAGQPEAASAAALALSADACRPPEGEIAAGARVGRERLAELADALALRVAPGEALTPAFVRNITALGEQCRGQRRVPVGIDDLLRRSLRQQLFGRELLLGDRLDAGLLRIALALTITIAGAGTDASIAHMTAMRTLRRPEPSALLQANGSQVWPILDALPFLQNQ